MEHNLANVLAGPILRNVTTSEINVWLVTSDPIALSLEVFDSDNQSVITEKAEFILNQQQIGTDKSRLWVCLLQIKLEENASFPQDQLLFYNIPQIELYDACLIGFDHPSFYIPSNLNVIAHGSCRKPHGVAKFDRITDEESEKEEGALPPDALSVLGKHLDENRSDLSQRPSHLFLSGDQIYADDVSSDLIDVLAKVAVQLMGEEHPLPDIDKPSELLHSAREATFEKLDCGLTSSKTENHLITFGEYAAMYIFVFGNRSEWHVETQDPYLRSFLKNLADVRRTFANVATYMIFDDHDVTDDWNLTNNWYDTVRLHPTGRRIVSNAIAAYYVFQHIGNCEDSLNDDLNQAIQLHLANTMDAKRCEYFDLYLWKHRQWAFKVATNPPVLVLDTRTQRDFTGWNRAAALLDRYAVDGLRLNWAKLQTDDVSQTPVIVSSTPVIGFNPAERAQSVLVKILALLMPVIRLLRGTSIMDLFTQAASVFDFESWIANKKGFGFFLDSLMLRMKIKKVVFLSGDVHYSFVNKAVYASGDDKLECLQLVSSAIHNSPKGSDILNGLAVATDQTKGKVIRRGLRPLRFPLNSSLLWRLEVEGVASNSDYDRFITRRPNIGLVYFEKGEVVSQKLLSGTENSHHVDFSIPKSPT